METKIHILHRTDTRPNMQFMSNLGPYQEFTTQAKAAGGAGAPAGPM